MGTRGLNVMWSHKGSWREGLKAGTTDRKGSLEMNMLSQTQPNDECVIKKEAGTPQKKVPD